MSMGGPSASALAAARLVGVVATAAYVGSLYLTAGLRGPRDAPRVLRLRMIAVSAATLALIAVAPRALTAMFGHNAAKSGAKLLGLLFSASQVARGLALVGVLFCGPLALHVRDGDLLDDVLSLEGLRNYVVGPVTEELAFRSVIMAAYAAAGASARRAMYENPLYFSLAHVHHFIGLRAAGAELLPAAVSTTVHAVMTAVFGLLSAFIFVRTGSVWASVAAHSFANLMGPPHGGGPWWYSALLVAGAAGFVAWVPFF